ncbi:MAG: NAD-binding protein [Synergistales bacterium]|nr:NAD-binding protein [Synergistales bacterium]
MAHSPRSVHTLLLWIGVLVLILGSGIAGFMTVAGLPLVDAVYYTVITLSTVGFNAPPETDGATKIFIVILLAVGIGTAGYALGQVVEHLVSNRILMLMGKRRDRKVNRLTDHWILCGLGRIGTHVAEILSRDAVPFVVVERSEERVSGAREQGWLVVQGDAREERDLESAGIHRAKGLIVALSSDADTVYVVLTARSLNSSIHITVRANEAQSSNVFYRAGAAKVMNPHLAGAAALTRAALKPSIAEFLELVNISKKLALDFDSLRIAADSSLSGQTLSESPLRSRYNILVIGITKSHGAMLYNPSGDTLLEAGDELIFLGEREMISRVRTETVGWTG